MQAADLVSPNRNSRIVGVSESVLAVHRNDRGELVEVLRSDWPGEEWRLPHAQVTLSRTPPGTARDEGRWHVHLRQYDRVVVVQGAIVLALYDARRQSETFRALELRHLGPAWREASGTLLIPPGVYHAFLCVGQKPAIWINMPTRLYDGSDEGRVPFTEAGARFLNGDPFSWQTVREFPEFQV